jgi:hypothetical protein
VTASLTSVACGVLALLLSGTPAALLACAAWCLPGMGHDAAQTVASTAPAPEVVTEAAALAPSAHAHHHFATPATPAAPAQPVPFTGSVSLSAPVAGADGHGCCPDATALTATTVTVASIGANARSTTWAFATRPTPYRHVRVTPAALLRLTAAATRPRPQTPLVLRV